MNALEQVADVFAKMELVPKKVIQAQKYPGEEIPRFQPNEIEAMQRACLVQRLMKSGFRKCDIARHLGLTKNRVQIDSRRAFNL